MSAESAKKPAYAAPSFRHLSRMTDDTGLIEHALGRIPRRAEGYTTDDNARALWVVSEWLAPSRAKLLAPGDLEKLTQLADIYLAFLVWCQREDGWFHNNVAYDRTPEPENVSYDCQGRSILGCACAWTSLPEGRREAAFALLDRALPTIDRIDSVRGRAFALAACAHLLESEARGRIRLPEGWAERLREQVLKQEEALVLSYIRHSDERWHWFEPAMTYGNGVLPWSLLRAFRITHRAKTLEIGLTSLHALHRAMASESGWYRPIGNESWHSPEASSRWDQQPLEMFKLALALDEAASVLALSETSAALEATGSDAWLAPDRTEASWTLYGAVPDTPDGSPAARSRGAAFSLGEADAALAPIRAGEAAAADRARPALAPIRRQSAIEAYGAEAAAARSESGAPPFGRAQDNLNRIMDAVRALSSAAAAGERAADRRGTAPPSAGLDGHAEALRKLRDRCLAWFYGDNDLHVPMIDPAEGACFDGLQLHGPNMNCGAEATISYLMTEALCCRRG